MKWHIFRNLSLDSSSGSKVKQDPVAGSKRRNSEAAVGTASRAGSGAAQGGWWAAQGPEGDSGLNSKGSSKCPIFYVKEIDWPGWQLYTLTYL